MRNDLRPDAPSAARSLRRRATEAERRLWALLRDRWLMELKFRRQVPLGTYIADFLCVEHRLIVEVDGSQHFENPKDETRDAWLAEQGYRVLRIWNIDVFKEPAAVQATIAAACGLEF